jgi:hypothetical protein
MRHSTVPQTIDNAPAKAHAATNPLHSDLHLMMVVIDPSKLAKPEKMAKAANICTGA